MSSFKLLYDFEQRKSESEKISKKYPDRTAIILENGSGSTLPLIDKTKYLVPGDLTASQFIYVIRKRLQLNQKQPLYIYINDIIPAFHETLADIYKGHKDADGFLYIKYSDINTSPSSPNPIELIVNLALLNFSKPGSKMTFYEGKLYIDKPDMYQGMSRWYYSSSRKDIIKFDVSLVQSLNMYYNPKGENIFKFAIGGLNKLKDTYKFDDSTSQILDNDIKMIENYIDKYEETEDSTENKIVEEINSLFGELDKETDKEEKKEITKKILKIMNQ